MMDNRRKELEHMALNMQARLQEHAPNDLKVKVIALGANGSTGACELCGAPDQELRPYGPRGERICFDCGTKDADAEATTRKQFARQVLGMDI